MSKKREEALNTAEEVYASRRADCPLKVMIAAALLEAEARGIRKAAGGYVCTCHEGFTSRKMIDPACLYHEMKDSLDEADQMDAEAAFLKEKT